MYLQFCRLRSNRFGKNGLTDACRTVLSKQAAPMSHDFFCHEPLPPDTRCGELRGRLSSRPPGAVPFAGFAIRRNCGTRSGGLQITPEHKSQPRQGRQQITNLLQQRFACKSNQRSRQPVNLERSTEFPLRRLAVRGCERTMSGAERRTSMKRSGTTAPNCKSAETKRNKQQITNLLQRPTKLAAGADQIG